MKQMTKVFSYKGITCLIRESGKDIYGSIICHRLIDITVPEDIAFDLQIISGLYQLSRFTYKLTANVDLQLTIIKDLSIIIDQLDVTKDDGKMTMYFSEIEDCIDHTKSLKRLFNEAVEVLQIKDVK